MKKTILKYLFFCCFFSYLVSAPHISAKKYPGQPECKVAPLKRRLNSLKFSPKFSLDSSIFKKIAVIIVDFRDQNFSSGWHEIANNNLRNFVDYYNEVSYGKLKLGLTFFYSNGFTTSTLTGNEIPYRMPRNITYYAQNTSLTLSRLIIHALQAAAGKVNSSLFDYVMVLHAGFGAETMPDPTGHIWSAYVWWTGSVYGFEDGIVVPERELNASALGVICHEFAHQLGLPDIYYGQTSVVGKWCLMDNGLWCGQPSGSMPAHLSAWGKKFLGWLEFNQINFTSYSVILNSIENYPFALKIPILEANDPQNEYFLLEYRNKTGFNSNLPYNGIILWHIDDTIALDVNRILANDINSGIPNLAIDLIEADRTSAGINGGDGGDVFPGVYDVRNFIPKNYSVLAYNGSEIRLTIKNIEIVDETNARLDIIFNVETTTQSACYTLSTQIFPGQEAGYLVLLPDATFYQEGTEVKIKAESNPGYIFSCWSGDAKGSENPLVVVMDSDKHIVANFISTTNYTMLIDTTPPQKVTTLEICLASTSTIKLKWVAVGDDFLTGDIVGGKYRLKYTTYVLESQDFWLKGSWDDVLNKYQIEWATHTKVGVVENYEIFNLKTNTTYYFRLWSVDESHNISEGSNIPFIFIPLETPHLISYYRISISINPENAGIIVVNPSGIIYKENTKVTLVAESHEGFMFDKWTGDVVDTSPTITIIMDEDKNLVANFKNISLSDNIETNKKYYFLSLNKDNVNETINFGKDIEEINIFDMKGKLLCNLKINFWNGEINNKTLSSGIYIYKIRYKNSSKMDFGYIILTK